MNVEVAIKGEPIILTALYSPISQCKNDAVVHPARFEKISPQDHLKRNSIEQLKAMKMLITFLQFIILIFTLLNYKYAEDLPKVAINFQLVS